MGLSIAARLIEIQTVMVDRFDAQPWIEPTADVSQDGKVSIQIYAPRGTDGQLGKHLRLVSGDTFEDRGAERRGKRVGKFTFVKFSVWRVRQ